MIVVMVAGGFDPIHSGHISHIREAAKLGDKIIVVTHPDSVLMGKKSFCFMPLNERIAILHELLLGTSHEIRVSIDGNGQVAKTIELLKPDIFAKGGDRQASNIPLEEIGACNKVGCKVVYGVGKDKTVGSSPLFYSAVKQLYENKPGRIKELLGISGF